MNRTNLKSLNLKKPEESHPKEVFRSNREEIHSTPSSINFNRDSITKNLPNVIFGSYGDVNELIKRKIISVKNIQLLILYEFEDYHYDLSKPIKEILQSLPTKASLIQSDLPRVQIGLYSSLLWGKREESESLYEKYLNEPVFIEQEYMDVSLNGVTQCYVRFKSEKEKFGVFLDIFSRYIPGVEAIVYCNSVRRANYLSDRLKLEDHQRVVHFIQLFKTVKNKMK